MEIIKKKQKKRMVFFIGKIFLLGFLVLPSFSFPFHDSNKDTDRYENVTLVPFQPPPKVFDFSSIAGYDSIKQSLWQVADFLQSPETYQFWDVRMPRGLLLYGPPGTGKTLFARCLTGELNRILQHKKNHKGEPVVVTFLITSGSEFVEKYVGVGAQRVRSLFQYARDHAPAILYIDEIDGIGRRRGEGRGGGHQEHETTLNQLMVEMDGFLYDKPFILVIGSTNRLEILDPALLRPGRFDVKVYVPLPDTPTRKAILDMYTPRKPFDGDLPWDKVAGDITRGLSGAEIENLLNEASLRGLRNNQIPVTYEDLLRVKRELIDFQSTSAQSQRFNYTHETCFQVAVHEIGHVVMSWMCDHHPDAEYVTVENPNHLVLGYTSFPQREESQLLWSLEEIQDKIRVLYGGRVAEEIVFGKSKISTGAVGDFRRIEQLARSMVSSYGMIPWNVSQVGILTDHPIYPEIVTRLVREEYEEVVRKMKGRSLVGVGKIRRMSEILCEKGRIEKNELDDMREIFFSLSK